MKIKAVARILLAAGALVAIFGMPGRAEPVNIVGFGDSLMAGYQLAPADAFPVKLEDALVATGNEVTIANAGVSGDTTSGGLSRLDWSVPEDADAVILELGANDALRGISPEKTRENLDAMIAALKGRGVEVLLVGMLAPPNMGDAYADLFNDIYPELAEKYDLILYPFFLDGVAAEEGLDIGDGMHPNPQGVDIMVTRFLPYAEQLLERLESGSAAKQ